MLVSLFFLCSLLFLSVSVAFLYKKKDEEEERREERKRREKRGEMERGGEEGKGMDCPSTKTASRRKLICSFWLVFSSSLSLSFLSHTLSLFYLTLSLSSLVLCFTCSHIGTFTHYKDWPQGPESTGDGGRCRRLVPLQERGNHSSASDDGPIRKIRRSRSWNK